MTNVLLTGINGFIGSNLASALTERGYTVYGVLRPRSSRNLAPIRDLMENITLLTADINDKLSISTAIKRANPDCVCHLAALSPVRYSFDMPFQYQETNFLGTMNVLHSIIDLPDFRQRHLIFASTAEVYGLQERTPFTEDLSLNPTSPYAVSKAAADMYVRMAMNLYETGSTILRPTNTYGRTIEKRFMIEYLVTSMLEGKKVHVGAPNSIRDYIYVTDHIEAYILAIENEEARGKIFNVGSSIGLTNKELTVKIAEILGFDLKKVSFGAYPPRYPRRPRLSDQPYLVLDQSRIERELGWKPRTKLDEGLRKVIGYWKTTSHKKTF